jgi:hypothetical protein
MLSLDLVLYKPYYYQPLPSSFEIVEGAFRLCYQGKVFASSLWYKESASKIETVKNRIFSIFLHTSTHATGMAIFPIAVCSAPLVYVADIITALCECTYCRLQEIEEIDFKEPQINKSFLFSVLGVIVSGFSTIYFLPLTALATAITYVAYPAITTLAFVFSLYISSTYCWDKVYLFTTSINDFISSPTLLSFEELSAWKNQQLDSLKKLEKLEEPTLSPKSDYLAIKKRLLEASTPEKVFELPDSFTSLQLSKAYPALSLIVHPDKNLERKEEADILQQLLNHAHDILKEKNET